MIPSQVMGKRNDLDQLDTVSPEHGLTMDNTAEEITAALNAASDEVEEDAPQPARPDPAPQPGLVHYRDGKGDIYAVTQSQWDKLYAPRGYEQLTGEESPSPEED